MKILLVSSEVVPFAKTGGLADVAGALPRALARLGHEVRVILPAYKTIETRFPLSEEGTFVLTLIDGQPRAGLVRRITQEGFDCYFVEHRDYFHREGLYGTAAGDYPDNDERFGFFCRAALDFVRRDDWRPDLIHVHDWQSALIPVLLRTEFDTDPFFRHTATVLTIHNLGYQGIFPARAVQTLGLDPALFTLRGMEYFGRLSLLKGGVLFSDAVNTVSRTYCREILTPEFGHGFEGILASRKHILSGILNGLEVEGWDPSNDSALPHPFSASDLRGKLNCKLALQKELGLEQASDIPVVAMVTRLDTQKGLDLVEDAWEHLMKRRLQFVLVGSGDRLHMERMAALQKRFAKKASINLRFDETLARRVYAGGDLFLMPSHYEPCGLGQLIALRYGCLPVVRRTGGLADTVFDPGTHPQTANGFSFEKASAPALLRAVDRALAVFPDRPRWLDMMRRGMTDDHSWKRAAGEYIELYQKALETRRGA